MKNITPLIESAMTQIVENAEEHGALHEALKYRDELKDELAEAQRRWNIGEARKGSRKKPSLGLPANSN